MSFNNQVLVTIELREHHFLGGKYKMYRKLVLSIDL